MSQSDDEEIQRLQEIQHLRDDRERHMADYVNLMRKFVNGGDDETKERAEQLIRAMKKIDDKIADLLKQ
jgi:pyocin large subunit-like protein